MRPIFMNNVLIKVKLFARCKYNTNIPSGDIQFGSEIATAIHFWFLIF